MQKPLVFLGGTCANNNWREAFTERLLSRGVNPEAIFNPVVADWNEEAQKREDEAKVNATVLLFYIADPQQEGNPLSMYSAVEAACALHSTPERTVVIFDNTGMTGHPAKAMKQSYKELNKTFPDALIFDSPVLGLEAVANLLK